MSFENVKAYLGKFGKADDILLFDQSSATVKEAARDLNTEECRIAKSMSFQTNDGVMIIVLAGDRKIDNRKYKDIFKEKAKMIDAANVEALTGHPVGGVCPFALKEDVKVYLDNSLKRFNTVFPAAGTPNSAIELTPDELDTISHAVGWIDVSKE